MERPDVAALLTTDIIKAIQQVTDAAHPVGKSHSRSGGAPAKLIVQHVISLANYQEASEIDAPPPGDGKYIVYPRNIPGGAFLLFRDVSKHHQELHGLAAMPTRAEYPDSSAFEHRLIPDGSHVLFASIGHILNNMLTTTDERTSLHAHLLESAADIPAYLRDKYRAILPFFIAAFRSLANKCDFYKRIMEQTSPYCFKSDSEDGLAFQHDKNLDHVGYKFQGSMIDKITGILKSVATGSAALVQDCTRTLTDIGDQPRYFEVSLDSINAYRSLNNSDPVMPLSALLRVVKTEPNSDDMHHEMYPKYGFGEPAFKYQYAIRGVLSAQGSAKSGKDSSYLQTLAALDSMVTIFNKYSHGGIKIDAGLAQDLAQGMTIGFDFIHDVKRVKRYISVVRDTDLGEGYELISMPMHKTIVIANARNSHTMTNTAIRMLTAIQDAVISEEVPTSFGMHEEDVSNIINIVENRNRDDAVRQVIAGTLGNMARTGDPIIANIVDMNIVPFDLHVLSRQMPLHFIWNYAFTFDSIVGTMLYDKMKPSKIMNAYFTGCHSNTATGQIDDLLYPITSARDALFAMLTDPYRTFDRNEKNWVDRMLVGATGIPEFARPKFLSDQIEGKILLGNPTFYSEVGPPSTVKGIISSQNYTPMADADLPMPIAVDDYGRVGPIASVHIADARDIHDMRMDTLLVRNFIHIGLVLSIVQMRLNGDVTYARGDRIAKSMGTLDPSIYKFFGMQTQEGFHEANLARETRQGVRKYI